MNGIIISLGSNLGDRNRYLAQARELIEETVGQIVGASCVIETASWGFSSSNFLNQVIRIETVLPPHALLEQLQLIERRLGRTHKRDNVHDDTAYSDRTIDLDILYYSDYTTDDARLTLPHPKIGERTFFHPLLREIGISVPESE